LGGAIPTGVGLRRTVLGVALAQRAGVPPTARAMIR